MEVKLSQAVKMFFGNSSLEMVYFEAIANSLDADATDINIDISAKAYNKPETLEIKISDNGVGLTDERYGKFARLLDVDEVSHKGLGRLVYLCYFENVKISSCYENKYYREFEFNEEFKKENVKISEVKNKQSGTSILMTGYALTKLHKNSFIVPSYLKGRILEEFYSRLFQIKQQKKNIKITISTVIEGKTYTESITDIDIPEFKKVSVDYHSTLFDEFHLYYSIIEVSLSETSLISAISVDNRTLKTEIIADENKIPGYKMIFLLFSDWFKGKVDASRQNLTVTSDSEKQTIQEIQIRFRKEVAYIIEKEIPTVKKRNKETKDNLINRYPHLGGYFNVESIGYSSRSDIIKKAQEQFFKAQKDLLEANSLSEEQYEKSLELSARALTEYILFRQITIENLKKTNNKNSEAEIHNLFASMAKTFNKEDTIANLYRNNAWILDDKYMTYEAVLSNKEMGEVIQFIAQDESTERDDDRPDLTLIFSNNPDKSLSFDVVIVELKKRGISLEENLKVVTQLEKRARKLMQYYKNKIQRIWFYGIVEFNDELELALTGEYKELYSTGKMYYRETKVAIQKNPDIILPIGVFVLDLDSVVNDADCRNSAFLNLIKSKFIENGTN